MVKFIMVCGLYVLLLLIECVKDLYCNVDSFKSDEWEEGLSEKVTRNVDGNVEMIICDVLFV